MLCEFLPIVNKHIQTIYKVERAIKEVHVFNATLFEGIDLKKCTSKYILAKYISLYIL